MCASYLMGIDVGTTMIKAAVFDDMGKEYYTVGTRVPVDHPKPGWAEKDMLVEWNAAKNSISKCLTHIRKTYGIKPEDIAGVSFSGEGAGTWLIDRKGEPVRPAIDWLDSRAVKILDRWQKDGTYATIYDETGWRMVTGWVPCIIRWLLENERGSLEKADWNIWAKDWIKYCITGEASTDETDTSLGLQDLEKRTYSKKALELYAIEEFERIFPPIIPSWKTAGEVTGDAEKETGLKRGTPVASGAWDVTSTALGAGVIDSGSSCIILGTAGIYEAAVDKPVIDRKERKWDCACHCVPNRWMIESFAMLAASNLDWFIKNFYSHEKTETERKGGNVYGIVNEEVSNTPLGSGGVIFHPFLQGERAPFIKPTARAQFFGLGDWHEKRHLLRSIYEGVAFSALDNYRVLREGCSMIGDRIRDIRGTGGGVKSETWCQILSDCLQCEVNIPAGSEFGARGAAINAGIAVNIFKDHKDAAGRMTAIEKTYRPDSEASRKYQKLFGVYQGVYRAVMDYWDLLYKIMEEENLGI